jgi:hypothetical protein
VTGLKHAAGGPWRTGWERLAEAVSEVLPPAEVDEVWTFSPIRREHTEWATAVLSRVEGERRRIYTARYALAVKGKERGKFESTVQEVGSGPADALVRVLRDAQRRVDDEHPPALVSPDVWFSSVAPPSDGPPR